MCNTHFLTAFFKITTVFFIALWLSGCAGLIAEQVQLAKNCKTSNVLITNLAKPEGSRETQLPNGKHCPLEYGL